MTFVHAQNVRHRHLWPGVDLLKVGPTKWPPSEIVNQIAVTRRNPDAGHVHWSVSALMTNTALVNALAAEVYRQPALIPASPWLDLTSPPPPKLSVGTWKKSVHVAWRSSGGESPRGWVLQSRQNGNWTTQILPASRADIYLDNVSPDAICIRAVNRVGNLSAPTTWQK